MRAAAANKKPGRPRVAGRRAPHAERRRESAADVGARKHAGMDPIVAEHPEIEPPDDRVESWQILPGKSDGRRPRGPEQELRIAQQNA